MYLPRSPPRGTAAWAAAAMAAAAVLTGPAPAFARPATDTNPRLSLTEARTVRAAALAALGREREAREEFDRAAALAAGLPYPAGEFAVEQARGADRRTG